MGIIITVNYMHKLHISKLHNACDRINYGRFMLNRLTAVTSKSELVGALRMKLAEINKRETISFQRNLASVLLAAENSNGTEVKYECRFA